MKSRPAAAPRRRSPVVGYLIVAAIIALCIVSMIVGWQVVFSPSHREWVECTVQSAKGGRVGGRGGGPAVLIDTSDCGRLVYRWKVGTDNRDELARQFQAGTAYDFLMAPVDRWTAAHHPNPIFEEAAVWKYRPSAR